MPVEAEFLEGPHRMRGQWIRAHALRVTHAEEGAEDFPPNRAFFQALFVEGALEGGEDLRDGTDVSAEPLELTLEDGCAHIRSAEGRLVLAERRPATIGRDGHVDLSFRIGEGEGFYGLGEYFDTFRRENGRVRLRIGESPFFLQGRQTYSAIPFFVSSAGYGLLFLNSHPCTVKIEPKVGVIRLEAEGPGADYLVIYGPSFRRILTTYTLLTGRPFMVPRWAFGLWGTSFPQESQAVTLSRLEAHEKRHIPLDVLILDYHWEKAYHTLEWRPSLFPDPDAFIAALRARGIRLGLIITPFLNTDNTWLKKRLLSLVVKSIPKGLEGDDERALEAFEEASSRQYLCHDSVGWWFGQGGLVDFTYPEAASWWNARLKRLYDQGVAFFKNDDGEYVPEDATSHLGMSGRELHNAFGLYYSKAMYEGMEALDDRRPMVYARSVWAGSQRYPAMFLGDQIPTFHCMKSTMVAGLNLAMSGFSYFTADIFGLLGRTTPETHIRYAQWALMVPIARYFWRPPEIDDTRFPWSHGPEAEASFRRHLELRYRLLPYYYALAHEAWRTGLPIMRPLALEFEGDPACSEVSDQVMLGPALMLAPVVEKRAVKRRVYLPEGKWYDFWSDAVYRGGRTLELPAPLDRLPLLVREGLVIPMGPSLQRIEDHHAFTHLELHLWPAKASTGWIYDDDGLSRAYLRGEGAVTGLEASEEEGVLTVRVKASEGSYRGMPETREMKLVLHQMSSPVGVTQSGDVSLAWQYRPSRQGIEVPFQAPMRQETVIRIRFSSQS